MFDADSLSKPMFVPEAGVAARPFLERLHDWIITVDHKKIGLMYVGYGVLFLVIGGIEAAIMRAQLAVANNHLVSPQTFNRMFTMHGTTMIFFAAMPIVFGIANYLVPLMIGARDMAFPRLNAFSSSAAMASTAQAPRLTLAGSPMPR
jgi:cytochrome c oxidase subunit 1